MCLKLNTLFKQAIPELLEKLTKTKLARKQIRDLDDKIVGKARRDLLLMFSSLQKNDDI